MQKIQKWFLNLSAVLAVLLFQNCSNRNLDNVTAVDAYEGVVLNTYESEQITKAEYEFYAGFSVTPVSNSIEVVFDHEAKNLEFKLIRRNYVEGSATAVSEDVCEKRLPLEAYNSLVYSLITSNLLKNKEVVADAGSKSLRLHTETSAQTYKFEGSSSAALNEMVLLAPSDLDTWFAQAPEKYCSEEVGP